MRIKVFSSIAPNPVARSAKLAISGLLNVADVIEGSVSYDTNALGLRYEAP